MGPISSGKYRERFRRWLPAAVIAAAMIAFFGFGLHHHIGLDALREHRGLLADWVARYVVAAPIVYILCYALMAALSVPGGAILSLAGGLLFGMVLGTIYTVVGATIGATLLFLAARSALGDALRAKAGAGIKKMEAGFRENALSYLLVLRLVPLFPFWLVNLVPAFLGVELRTYVVGTFIGIIPGTFVYVSVGNGLGAIFDAGEAPDLGIIFQPQILIPIVGLAVLALIPVIYKRLKRTRDGNGPQPSNAGE